MQFYKGGKHGNTPKIPAPEIPLDFNAKHFPVVFNMDMVIDRDQFIVMAM